MIKSTIEMVMPIAAAGPMGQFETALAAAPNPKQSNMDPKKPIINRSTSKCETYFQYQLHPMISIIMFVTSTLLNVIVNGSKPIDYFVKCFIQRA